MRPLAGLADGDEMERLRRHLLPLITAHATIEEATREETFTMWTTFVERLAQENRLDPRARGYARCLDRPVLLPRPAARPGR